MLTEEIEVTFSHLLELAVGNPEAGAVNFCFLHEFLRGILDHLGIAENRARITTEIDYRDRTNSAIPRTASVPGAFVSSESDNGSAAKIQTDANKNGETEEATKPADLPETKSTVAPLDGQVAGRRRSTMTHKRMSVAGAAGMSHRGSLAQFTSQSGESLTKAGDMWHVLNINRRVETAEAALEGLTSLFDRMSMQLDEMKQSQEGSAVSVPTPAAAVAPVAVVEKSSGDFGPAIASAKDHMSAQLASVKEDISAQLAAVKNQMSSQLASSKDQLSAELLASTKDQISSGIKSAKDELSSSISSAKDKTSAQISEMRKELHAKTESCPSKDDLKDLCTAGKVTELINKNMLAFTQQSQPTVTTAPTEGAGSGDSSGSGVPIEALNALQTELRISTKCLNDRIDTIDNSLETKIVSQQDQLKEIVSKLQEDVTENKEKIEHNKENIASTDANLKLLSERVDDLGNDMTNTTRDLNNNIANLANLANTTQAPVATPPPAPVPAPAQNENPRNAEQSPPDMTPLIEPLRQDLASLHDKITSLNSTVSTMDGNISNVG